MKTSKTPLFMFIIVCYTFVLFGAALAADAPKAAVKSTIESILETLRDKDLTAPAKKEERRNKIRELIGDRFNFKEMAKRSLARHWKKITPEEKKEFVAVFSELLENSYIGKIEAYTDEKITYDKEVIKGKGKYGIVSTTIVTKSVDIPIDYKVKLKDNRWRVYDIVIEGVSFVSTYRNQYNKALSKESFAKLIQKMRAKLDEANAPLEKEAPSKN